MTSSPPAKRFDWGNLGLRAVSAAILAPVALACAWLGGVSYWAILAAAVVLLSLELGAMCDAQTPVRAAALIGGAVLIGVASAWLGHPNVGWMLVLAGALVGALFALQRGRIDRPADIAFGVVYLGGPAVALMWLRSGPEGRAWVVTLLAVTWAADIGAFAVGSVLKGPKLWPRFSPNKTWSGFVGGLLAAAAAGWLVAAALARGGGPSPAPAAGLGLLAGLATMGGDLLESMLKRRFGVKDSGQLIPGHGGLLDRVDGLMFAGLTMAAARLAFDYGPQIQYGFRP